MKKLISVLAAVLFLAACDGGNAPYVSQEGATVPFDEVERFSELLESAYALEILSEGVYADVLDIATGITYRVRRAIGGYNTLADVETVTQEDTDKLLETTGGGWCIRRRAIIVTVEGRQIAASIAPFQHSGSEEHPFGEIIDNRSGGTGTGINLDSIRDNGMTGVVDIFFFNSLIPGINRVDERHQEMVLMAYDFTG
ncbi:MAG: hypothetical protein FWB96_06060 [Defluviitaleaceae bacterium]|nr:hypothetical protein [Defluviitaleaceae bacterium]MCL2262433.1 hypothetical protein [Defluviitaleaceae bacterium]